MIDLLLSKDDWKMILDGLDALKNRSVSNELMGELFETMLLAPKDGATQKEKDAWAERKKQKEAEKALKKAQEEAEKNKIDVLKSKIILMQNQEPTINN